MSSICLECRDQSRPVVSAGRAGSAERLMPGGPDGWPAGRRAGPQRWPPSRSAAGVRRAKLGKRHRGDLKKARRRMTAVIEVTGLTKRYERRTVVDGIS